MKFMTKEHNSHLEDNEQVIEVLKKAVVDDVLIPSSLNNWEKNRVALNPRPGIDIPSINSISDLDVSWRGENPKPTKVTSAW